VEGSARLALAAMPGADAAAAAAPLHALGDTLSRIGLLSGALTAAIALMWWLRSRRSAAPAPRHVTWGCGYTAPNRRMQYTGSSFAWDFGRRFQGVLLMLRRQKAPEGYFPVDGYLITHCPDAVERRLFAVIKHGDESAAELSRHLREDDPRVAFGAALVAVVLIAALVVLGTGALR
jgi:hydrogenase-4 component B